ncbi:MAG TPA: BON domain-containing protein [Oligoflexus sp.]|uniref:BON domain-containing protein n=1 Tax=Oligoflexus sp. TaxID=1971216 RepID=UPI002D502BAA|nr:BON domain-containing protein [Oligoflexus sp.]HYX31782.1 BON domain-containing protein [Oligoflexus sp.]
MFEQSFENEDRYSQQGRRSQTPYWDRRSIVRGHDDRYESQDRNRYRGSDSERRYTRPDYDSDLDIERPGQPHFGSRGGSDYGRDYDQDSAWQRPYRSRSSDRHGYEGSHRYDYGRGQQEHNNFGRGMSDYGRGQQEYSNFGGRGISDYGRDWQSTGAGMGHADWNRFGSDDQNHNWGRRAFDQNQGQNNQQTHFNDKNRWPKSYKRSDERLKDDIHEELIRHGRIDASDIEVEVKDGEVTLTGQVASRQDKRIAEELAEKVLGVHDVQNQLRVRSQSQSQQQGQSADQRSGSNASMSGSNRMSVAGQQQQDPNKSTLNSTSK